MDVFASRYAQGKKLVVGMLHAPALPGSPRYAGDWQALRAFVQRDAAALAEGGVDGMMLENFGDTPFFKGRVPAEVVACLTCLATDIKSEIGSIPLGINVLRNDGESAIAVAVASGAQMVRVNVLSGAVVTDQGVIEGDAARLLRRRREMGAEAVSIWADARVKHAAPFGPGWRPFEEEIDELVQRGGAGGVVVSGTGTGKPTDENALKQARSVLDRLDTTGPVGLWVGSGATVESAGSLLQWADGIIVGTGLKTDGKVGAAVDPCRVRDLVQAVSAMR